MKTNILLIDMLTFLALGMYIEETKAQENFSLTGGVISTTQFHLQENFFGYNDIIKSLYGYDENLGITAKYAFGNLFSADATIANVEGDKQLNEGIDYGFGLTFTPIKGLLMRVYTEWKDNGKIDKTTSLNMAAFLGYKCEKFIVGAEYKHILKSIYMAEKDLFGYSIFASVKLTNFADLYVRFDDLFSKYNLNIAKVEHAALLGVQFRVNEKIKISPNFKMNIPKTSGLPYDYLGYINFSINL